MQDDYVKAFENIKLDDKRKAEMRKALEMELAASRTPAKKTGLSGAAKAGIAVAAITLTMAGLLVVPTTRNAIYAGIKDIFHKEVPEDAVDSYEKQMEAREERVIPTDEVPESVASEIIEQVAQQDYEEDQYYADVLVSSDYYEDADIKELASYYEQQGYKISDLQKVSVYNASWMPITLREWFTDGFVVDYWIGDNAYGYGGSTIVFKATEEQFQNYLQNELDMVNYNRVDHKQEEVTFDEFWTVGTDEEGNTVYTGTWEGPEPEIKLLDSDRARFATYEVTYDPGTQIAICESTEGGGVG